MEQIFERVANWNAARYKREYNHDLTLRLLTEEFNEWLEAPSNVDRLHELCDIAYVALGAIWKYDVALDEQEVAECYQVVDLLSTVTSYRVGLFISSVLLELELQPVRSLYTILLLAQAEMFSMGLTYEQTIEAMLILCDSNDSKKIVSCMPDVKANHKDKGTYYKSPTARLTELWQSVRS